MSHDKKSKPFPITMLEGFKKRLNKRSIELDVNRSWLTRVFIDYGFRNMSDQEISELAKNDIDSTPRKKFKR